MWTPTTRLQHIRETSRYQTDLTDEEWRVIGPYLPAAKSTGRPRVWPMREIINGIFYVMRSGCPWRLLPSDLPPWNTIYRWFATFRNEGRFEKINHALACATGSTSAGAACAALRLRVAAAFLRESATTARRPGSIAGCGSSPPVRSVTGGVLPARADGPGREPVSGRRRP
jgi:transposase